MKGLSALWLQSFKKIIQDQEFLYGLLLFSFVISDGYGNCY
ncbi:hypothetical protein ASZ90_012156 [hydrocarbon metagenome]|uniref:Uncharacterized protein n=1 Tax=hydrocarbon metagenome TaxID=938273 RepID=A0A0W8FB90_9ZZZZ